MQMSDTSSDLYKRTFELGLPDRLIGGFRESSKSSAQDISSHSSVHDTSRPTSYKV